MTPQAIGMVETEGLVAAVEACDAMLKAAEVRLVEQDITHPGLVTIIVEGEVAACRSAVDAGAVAAARVGRVYSTHVIPRPHETLKPGLAETPHRHLDRTSTSGQDLPPGSTASPNTQSPEQDTPDLAGMTVGELRYLARRLENFSLSGREISKARRTDLLEQLRRYFEGGSTQ